MGVLPAQARASDSALGPRLPMRVGRFTLCEELGAGGMATVYLARMELAGGLDRLVALKTIHPHLAKEPNFVDMFLDEARIASHVGHPNVCASYDFGETDGVYYLAMEHLFGEPLFDLVNKMVEHFEEVREVLPYLAARIIADAAEGIHAAHAARGPSGEALDIVHRDVSPQNLFVTYDGSVKVVDFGCAKAAERVAHTSTGVLKGKVGYAAPEQLRADHVDHRADIWALGVCLFEGLTLSPLFSRDTAVKTAMAVLEMDVPLASVGRSWVPERVAKIAARALARDPKDRYTSARQLSRDLREFIADSGYSLEAAEISEWMEFLFGERRAERMAQVQRARDLDLSKVATGALYEVGPEDVELLHSSEHAVLDAIVLPDDGGSEATVVRVSGEMRRASNVAKPRGGRRGLRAVIALAVLALLVAGGAYVYRHYEPADWVYELLGSAGEAGAETGTAAETEAETETETVAETVAETETETETEAETETAAESETETAAESETETAAESETETAAETAVAENGAGGRSGSESGRRSGDRGGLVTTVVASGSSAPAHVATPVVAPDPPHPPPSAATGLVVLSASSGYAEVYLGGRRLGRTPLREELPVGRHRLRILPYGQEPAETLEVSVEAGLDQSFVIDVGAPPAP